MPYFKRMGGETVKREKVYVDERRERIRDILREKSQVRVEALAEELKVSVITIRRIYSIWKSRSS